MNWQNDCEALPNVEPIAASSLTMQLNLHWNSFSFCVSVDWTFSNCYFELILYLIPYASTTRQYLIFFNFIWFEKGAHTPDAHDNTLLRCFSDRNYFDSISCPTNSEHEKQLRRRENNDNDNNIDVDQWRKFRRLDRAPEHAKIHFYIFLTSFFIGFPNFLVRWVLFLFVFSFCRPSERAQTHTQKIFCRRITSSENEMQNEVRVIWFMLFSSFFHSLIVVRKTTTVLFTFSICLFICSHRRLIGNSNMRNFVCAVFNDLIGDILTFAQSVKLV